MMIAETPADSICKMYNFNNGAMYKVMCQCGDDKHAHDVMVENDDGILSITTYTTQTTPFWNTSRFKTIWTLLTKGYVEYTATMIMSEQQALNYAEALKNSIQNLKEK